jgi:hypothetical protein
MQPLSTARWQLYLYLYLPHNRGSHGTRCSHILLLFYADTCWHCTACGSVLVCAILLISFSFSLKSEIGNISCGSVQHCRIDYARKSCYEALQPPRSIAENRAPLRAHASDVVCGDLSTYQHICHSSGKQGPVVPSASNIGMVKMTFITAIPHACTAPAPDVYDRSMYTIGFSSPSWACGS